MNRIYLKNSYYSMKLQKKKDFLSLATTLIQTYLILVILKNNKNNF